MTPTVSAVCDIELCVAAIEEFRCRHQVPGVALCLFDQNGPRHTIGLGQLSVEQPQSEVTGTTVFCACSLAKCVTATLACDLAQSGELDLDRRIDDYLPGLRLRGRPDAGGVTVSHLLSNTAGFVPDRVKHGESSRNADDLERETLAEVSRMPLIARPGEVFSYSNVGMALAGCVAQHVTGVPFAELVRDRVLRPLEMDHTFYDPAEAMTYPLMQQHTREPAGSLRVIHQAEAGIRHQPAGLCFTTVTDMAKFGALHLRHARDPHLGWLSPAHHGRVDIGLDIDLHYGLGMFVGRRAGHRWLGHEGFYQGMWCKLLIVPAKGIGLIWADNRGPEIRSDRYRVIDRLLRTSGIGEPDRRSSSTQDVLPARSVAGRYQRFGATALNVRQRPQTDDLHIGDGTRTIHMRRVAPTVWATAPTDHEEPPWTPHADTRSISLGFRTCPESGDVTHLRLNGLPYARTSSTTRRLP